MFKRTFSHKSLRNYLLIAQRNYAFKSDLKIKWVRPEKIPCIRPEKSGDLSGLPKIDLKMFKMDFKMSKELQNADDSVKSLFMLQNNKGKYTSYYYREMLIKKVQRHSQDYGSMEAKLAKMTATIRKLQERMEEFPRNKKAKVVLKELIDKRKKYLKYLRRWDYKRFEWMLEQLNLVYKPSPPEFRWVTRKESLRKLTNKHCQNIKKKRLKEYREKLESQQEDFLVKKLANLEFIRKEQEECQVPVTVQGDDINKVRKKLEDLRIKMEIAGNQINNSNNLN